MAKAKSTDVSSAIQKWDEQFAADAEAAMDQVASLGGGQFFSLKGGILKFNDAPLPNNEMAVIVADHVLENVYYADGYDPENTTVPTCYAFGRKEKEMGPHEEAADKQCDKCADCAQNAWGSGSGRGKACRNRVRLACVSAGTFENGKFKPADPEEVKKGVIGFLAVPPTSINGWGAYVKQIGGSLKRPPHGVVTKVKVVPDPKTTFKVTFEAVETVKGEMAEAAIARNSDAKQVIVFPYSAPSAEDKPAKSNKGKGKGKKY